MIASIRYLDQFVKMDGHWYFRQRKLMVDWIDNRPLGGDWRIAARFALGFQRARLRGRSHDRSCIRVAAEMTRSPTEKIADNGAGF